MNREKLAPDDNGRGKMDKLKVVLRLLLKTNEQLAEIADF